MQLPTWYTTPTAQVILVGITCFATVGMFQAVNNLGAGGTEDVRLSDTAQGALFATFSLMGLVGGGITNLLGPRLTLFLGTLGYALYVGALWCFQTQGTRWFLILAGVILGATAALLWSAQGTIMMAYPAERDKAKAFSIFWVIFQSGTFLGALVSLAINIRSGGLHAVSAATYIAFLVIMCAGIASALLVLPPRSVVRGDGTRVSIQKTTSVSEEIKGMGVTLRDWRVLALSPMFFSSNYFYAYQGAINAGRFDGPTRALNATLEGAGAIVGALFIGVCVLDGKINFGRQIKRRTRGYAALVFTAALTIAVYGVQLRWQLSFTRADAHISKLARHFSCLFLPFPAFFRVNKCGKS